MCDCERCYILKKSKEYIEYQPLDPNSHARSLNHANMLRKNTDDFSTIHRFSWDGVKNKGLRVYLYTLQS